MDHRMCGEVYPGLCQVHGFIDGAREFVIILSDECSFDNVNNIVFGELQSD